MPRRRPPRRFSPEFRAEAVRLVHETNESLTKIARDLGVSRKSLSEWVTAVRPPARDPVSDDERQELVQLRRENQQLRMERDLLKKATAFFARQSE
jgi:transposase